MQKERIIMGVDPGTKIMGYGIIEVKNGQMKAICYDIINLSKFKNHALKLKKISERMSELIEQYAPDEMALESPFYSKNVQVALKLGRAQGVAMAAALVKEIPISEYAPRKIKQSVTGQGEASKEQVASMLKNLLKLADDKIIIDATDALGVAVCHYFQTSSGIMNTEEKVKGWGAFLKNNPDRIK
ncbi:MAG: crossover junction endodeoxyribonuclease RuvC [Cytophagia bacterium]|nr:MAG: crossover junction endodeoxyribonuclease RuvC [Cytophagia bacterium]TAG45703.1 MAG: crossover junction endodeoxyribonuclease RuvC [Cytophagia bacterium]TAH28168.1 MAG: crossover junction endodeoxyribonuclease RuvC [Cytophagales bacterium]